MAAVEIDETELLSLQRNSKLMAGALANPEARKLVLRALKTSDPSLAIPEIDATAPLNGALDKLNERFDSLDKKIDAEKEAREGAERTQRLTAQWNEGRGKVQRQGYVGESLEALEKFMEEKGVADHEIAAAAFEKLHPQAQPVNSNGGKFDFFNRESQKTDERLKKLWETGDENAFLGPAIDEVLKQERGFAA